jgi:hypothetical protein
MPDDTVPSGTFGDYSVSNTNAEPNVRRQEVCQRSGFKAAPGELVKDWTGLWVLPRFRERAGRDRPVLQHEHYLRLRAR